MEQLTEKDILEDLFDLLKELSKFKFTMSEIGEGYYSGTLAIHCLSTSHTVYYDKAARGRLTILNNVSKCCWRDVRIKFIVDFFRYLD